MNDHNHAEEGCTLPFQGPHWQRGARQEGSSNLPPLRLVLQPSGLVLEIVETNTIVGRHSSSGVRLPLPDVSRQHCRFIYEDGQWHVLDLKSLNGVYVNEVKVEHAPLQVQDRVRIGGFIFEVEKESRESDHAAVHEAEHEAAGEMLRSIADALPPATLNHAPLKRQAS